MHAVKPAPQPLPYPSFLNAPCSVLFNHSFSVLFDLLRSHKALGMLCMCFMQSQMLASGKEAARAHSLMWWQQNATACCPEGSPCLNSA